MNVNVIGGGPGGAFTSLLLKKHDPSWDVTVFERYPPSTTYGWAIVLPEKTYSILREADEPMCERIQDATVRWDPIDTVHQGERVRCGSHPYTSVMRNELLEILQNRCRELGVDFRFEAEVDPTEIADESDLLIGADGLGSETRETFAEGFEPTLIEREDKYTWFGTDQPFEALTHVYEENEHGVWHGAAYPARTTSTFVVTVDTETWHDAGMDDATGAESLEYVADLFGDHLDGHGLRSKDDRWRQFLTVKNERWHHENVVLVGDAAHTAHFTIGSGTRMAMEDAVALAEGFERFPGDMDGALDWYESRRKPHVEALQRAADLSVTHFENLSRYVGSDPERLAFLYLTRTGSNSYEALRDRDPTFIDGIDRWFAGTCGGDPGAEPADQPFSLRELTVENRFVAPVTVADTAVAGTPDDAHLRHVVERGREDAELVVTNPVAVSSAGRITPGTPGLYESNHAGAWSEAVDRIHDHGSRVGTTLVHAGRRGSAQRRTHLWPHPLPKGDSWETLAPSAIPYDDGWPTPTEMDGTNMTRVREAFAGATERADAAGFDVLSVHAGHGYLLGSFLSPLTNHRGDEYGGDLSARLEYPTSVVAAVRAAWPDSKPLSVTLPATDWAEGGFDVEDASVAARAFQDAGCDVMTVVAGGTVPHETPVTDPSRYRRYSHWIGNETDVPTVSTTYLTTRDEVNTMVAGGRADLCYWYPPSGTAST